MIDVEHIDRMFELGRQGDAWIIWRFFDRRRLVWMRELSDFVKQEAGVELSEAKLRTRAEAGWFPILKGLIDGETYEEGAPFYVGSRIKFLCSLEQAGYAPAELRMIASHEEWAIDNVLTTDDLTYDDYDDDLKVLLSSAEARVSAIEHGGRRDPNGQPIDTSAELKKARADRDYLRRLQGQGVPPELEETIAKHAFRARAINDVVRAWLLEMDRAKIAAGYGLVVQFEKQSFNDKTGFRGENISWRGTVRSALAYAESAEGCPIRVPGFLLDGDRVIPTRTLRPSEYASLWKEHQLEDYLQAWAAARQDRRCQNCFAPLTADADERRRFCGEKCRNAAKQRRYRERHPEAIERTQKSYWESVALS